MVVRGGREVTARYVRVASALVLTGESVPGKKPPQRAANDQLKIQEHRAERMRLTPWRHVRTVEELRRLQWQLTSRSPPRCCPACWRPAGAASSTSPAGSSPAQPG